MSQPGDGRIPKHPLNNLSVRSLLSEAHTTHFGFTELEVAELPRSAGGADSLDGLRHWYNGYVFGGQVVYNPWSVLSFLASPDHSFQPCWVNTASNELVRRLIVRGGPGVAADLETLLDGGALERRVDDNIALRQVHRHPGALWSFLVSSGYLTTHPGCHRPHDDLEVDFQSDRSVRSARAGASPLRTTRDSRVGAA